MGKWRKPKGGNHRWSKRLLIKRDGTDCKICSEPMLTMHDMTLDHKIPLSRGGSDTIENLQLTHGRCNQEKANMTVEEFTAWQLGYNFYEVT